VKAAQCIGDKEGEAARRCMGNGDIDWKSHTVSHDVRLMAYLDDVPTRKNLHIQTPNEVP